MRIALLLGLVLLLAPACSSSGDGGLGGLLDAAVGAGNSRDSRIVAGLKEALQVGTRNTVSRTSVVDGYLGNAMIRILLPEQVRPAADMMRRVGLGSQLDNLQTQMNRAAEMAAREATPIFLDAIRGMTIRDARGILEGGETAATEFFRRTTSAPLRARYAPIVEAKMAQVGLARTYADLAGRYNAIPAVPKLRFDLNAYVIDKALDGLFTVLGEEERRIRTDPAARVTELLREVFGQ
ncbi:MAG: DUF4197 domain-containing protein [Planctomycetota bacterium]|nr:DUF4197 domain-containing protein [Planctomycetota bacterium]